MIIKMRPLMAPEGSNSGGRAKLPPESIMREKGLDILVVDDYKNILRMMSAVLSSIGHAPITARDGKEGLETFLDRRARGEPVELVITDLDMPLMDGCRLLKEIKRIDPRIPVIVMTSHFGSDDPRIRKRLAECKECGALAVMGKDFSISDIDKAVKLAKAGLNE
jgi:CheY-like chemotaxis protein